MQSIDLRPEFLTAGDQGKRGTCIVFAVTANHEYFRYKETGAMTDLSEEALYYQCKVLDGDRDAGTSFSSIALVLQTVGQPAEDKWVYDKLVDDTQPSYVLPADAVDPQFCFRASLTSIQSDINGIVDCLTKGSPVSIGIPVYDSFRTALAGRVPMPLDDEKTIGDHSVLVVGCEEDAQQSKWLIFRNSWGVRWGEEGYGFLPFEYIERFGCEAYIVESATTP